MSASSFATPELGTPNQGRTTVADYFSDKIHRTRPSQSTRDMSASSFTTPEIVMPNQGPTTAADYFSKSRSSRSTTHMSASSFATPELGTLNLGPTPGTDYLSQTKDGTLQKRPVVCVFCGASKGIPESHYAAARQLGQAFAAQGIKLVYGGGTSGLMGEIAKTVVKLSGPEAVHGIIPRALVPYERGCDPEDPESVKVAIKESEYGVTTVVGSMHSRKQLMMEEVMSGGPGSGYVALSGGYGTLEELLEVTTWNQLAIHDRGVVVFNFDHFYDGLMAWVRNAVQQGFIAKGNAAIMQEATTAEEVLTALMGYRNVEGRFNLNWTTVGKRGKAVGT